MKIKKIVAVMLACICIALTSTACSGGSKAANGGQGNVQITFLHKYCQPDQAPLFADLCKQYEKSHPNVTIKVETTTDDGIKDKLRVELGGGSVPDIYQTWSGEYAQKFVRAGAALDLTSYLTKDPDWKKIYIPSALDAFVYNDKNYAIPTRFDAEYFVYNKKTFNRYGLKEPSTWDDLMKICATLKSNNVTPFVLGNQLPWDAPHWFGALWEKYVPKSVLDKDYDVKTVSMTDPNYVKALYTFKDLLDKGYFTSNINSVDHDMALQNFYAGKGAMIYLEYLEFWDISKNMKDDWGFFPMPQISGAQGDQNMIFGGPEGFMVSAKTKNPSVTVDVLKWLTNKENETRKVKEIGHSSSVIGAVNSSNSCKQCVEGIKNIQTFKGISVWTDCALEGSIVDVMLKEGQSIVNGTITPEQYMKKMQDAAAKVKAQNS